MSEKQNQETDAVAAVSESDLGGVLLLERLLDIAEAARDFVATTSYYRQTKVSRPPFERLAVALLSLSVNSDGLQTVAPKDDSDSPAGTGTGKTE